MGPATSPARWRGPGRRRSSRRPSFYATMRPRSTSPGPGSLSSRSNSGDFGPSDRPPSIRVCRARSRLSGSSTTCCFSTVGRPMMATDRTADLEQPPVRRPHRLRQGPQREAEPTGSKALGMDRGRATAARDQGGTGDLAAGRSQTRADHPRQGRRDYREVNGVRTRGPAGSASRAGSAPGVPVMNRARNLDKGEGAVAPNDAEECGRTPAIFRRLSVRPVVCDGRVPHARTRPRNQHGS